MTPANIGQAINSLIAREGPIPVARYMELANRHYYATRDPLGAAGDFITAPEISQMFGELIGLWFADLWLRKESPANTHFVELGPGRGTLAADALRAMRGVRFEPPVHFVETSPVLRAAQAERVANAQWHDSFATIPARGPLLIVANEFFDALPVRQLVATHSGWRERVVARDRGRFVALPGSRPVDELVPDKLRDSPPGSILELAPAAHAVVTEISERLARQGGAALIIDYGYEGPAIGDSLQSVSRHRPVDPFAEPGARDLTAHVDFVSLAFAAGVKVVRVFGPVAQGDWLEALGLGERAASLAKAAPHRAEEILAARKRLVEPGQMGRLFRVLAVLAPDWPRPEGF